LSSGTIARSSTMLPSTIIPKYVLAIAQPCEGNNPLHPKPIGDKTGYRHQPPGFDLGLSC
jgi:hypothetical protein